MVEFPQVLNNARGCMLGERDSELEGGGAAHLAMTRRVAQSAGR